MSTIDEEETTHEPQEAPEAPEVQQPETESPPASAPDADGADEETPAEEASELIQHADGRFETRVANPIRNE